MDQDARAEAVADIERRLKHFALDVGAGERDQRVLRHEAVEVVTDKRLVEGLHQVAGPEEVLRRIMHHGFGGPHDGTDGRTLFLETESDVVHVSDFPVPPGRDAVVPDLVYPRVYQTDDLVGVRSPLVRQPYRDAKKRVLAVKRVAPGGQGLDPAPTV